MRSLPGMVMGSVRNRTTARATGSSGESGIVSMARYSFLTGGSTHGVHST